MTPPRTYKHTADLWEGPRQSLTEGTLTHRVGDRIANQDKPPEGVTEQKVLDRVHISHRIVAQIEILPTTNRRREPRSLG